MLSSKQRSYLRKLAHDMQPVFQVGKGGVGDTLVNSVSEALEARELIKLSVLNNNDADLNETAHEIASKTGAEVVSVIGRKLILYRAASEKPKITLPRL